MSAPKRKSIFLYLYCLAFCLGGGIIFARFLDPLLESVFPHLEKPLYTLPSSAFIPIWIFLYILIATSLFLFWTSEKKVQKSSKSIGFFFFFLQLGINFFWSFLFYFLQSPLLAFLDLIFVTAFLIPTLFIFYRFSKLSAYLLLPYLLFTLIGIYFSYELWKINP